MLNYQEHIAPYLIDYGKKLPDRELLHPYYDRAVARKKLLADLFGGEYPDFLDADRPKEKDKPSHKKYRRQIYKAFTKPFRSRVTKAVAGIRNADDWAVEFPKLDEGMPYEDSLRFFVTEDFGPWRSFEQWFWKQGVQRYIDDPNAVAVLMPLTPDRQSQYTRVKPMWATSAQVWYYEEGERAVIRAEETSTVQLAGGKSKNDGLVLHFFDRDSYATARMVEVRATGGKNSTIWEVTGLLGTTDESGAAVITENFPRHYSRTMPCFRLGNIIEEASEDGRFVLYESLIDVAVPNLRTVLQRASDIEIEALLHTGTLEWQYVAQNCRTCKGKGVKLDYDNPDENGRYVERECKSCNGTGKEIQSSNLEKLLISPPTETQFTEGPERMNLPIPPGGFIERSAEALKEFRTEYERNFREAYQAVGLGHIAEQLFQSTSGTSKRYDRAEGEALLIDTAKHFTTEIIKPCYVAIDAIRYGPAGKAGVQVPTVKAPRRFDITTREMTREEMKEALGSDATEEIKDALQLRYIEQIAGKESVSYRSFRVKMMLDPYRNQTAEAKAFMKDDLFLKADRKSEKFREAIRAIDYSQHFDLLIRNVLLSNPDFYDLEIDQQAELLTAEHDKFFSLKPANEPMSFSQLTPLTDVNDINQNIGG